MLSIEGLDRVVQASLGTKVALRRKRIVDAVRPPFFLKRGQDGFLVGRRHAETLQQFSGKAKLAPLGIREGCKTAVRLLRAIGVVLSRLSSAESVPLNSVNGAGQEHAFSAQHETRLRIDPQPIHRLETALFVARLRDLPQTFRVSAADEPAQNAGRDAQFGQIGDFGGKIRNSATRCSGPTRGLRGVERRLPERARKVPPAHGRHLCFPSVERSSHAAQARDTHFPSFLTCQTP